MILKYYIDKVAATKIYYRLLDLPAVEYLLRVRVVDVTRSSANRLQDANRLQPQRSNWQRWGRHDLSEGVLAVT